MDKKSILSKVDWWVIIPLIGLSLFGIFNIFGSKPELFLNQVAFNVVGFVVFFVFYSIGYQCFKDYSKILYIVLLSFLLFTWIFAEPVRGSKRWFEVWFFRFQPSEILKVFFLIYIAKILSGKELFKKKITKSFLAAFIPFFIILRQPDLTSALLYLGTFISLLFFAGVSFVFLAVGAALIAFVLPLMWKTLQEYQRQRITSFINPSIDNQRIAYNLIQSVITVGSGCLWGRGLGLGTQSRFRFLPEYHTDFAFASLIEQFGVVGGVAVLVLFGVLLYRLTKKAIESPKGSFKFLLLAGSVVMIALSVGINIGMNIGLLPVAGVPLPFISYGGSSLVATMMILGIAMRI